MGLNEDETAPLPQRPPTFSGDDLAQIGPYRILSRIGEGGMGIVYKAEQHDGLRRLVAVKVIKAGMDTREVVARFDAERQALALMSHPGVARVFDAGATGDGRPYFVMEFVPGVSITRYCDQEKLTTRERLELFIEVCRAVQHAHQKGIIHRDLKPGNILVTVSDGKAIPKIIDFGIAKATVSRLTDHTLVTEVGRLIGTPEYMSPEQAHSGGLDVDTRTDIFALGVILYELLTSCLPFDSAAIRGAGLAAVAEFLKSKDAPKPSTRLYQPSDTKTATSESIVNLAKTRKTDPRSLLKEVRGDLDWITLKAIEKERGRRYETATALADDILRHLNHEPVTARPPSRGYRLSRFIRKHRVGVVATTVVLLAVIGGSVGMTIGLVQARHALSRANSAEATANTQKNLAVAAQSKAEHEATKANAASEFITSALAAADPGQTRAAVEIRVVELLDKAAAECDVKFAGDPETAIRIHTMLANAYENLGLWDRVEPNYRKAFELSRDNPGTDFDASLKFARRYAWSMVRTHDLRKLIAAEKILRPATQKATEAYGTEDSRTVLLNNILASSLYSQKDPEKIAEGEQLAIHLAQLARRSTDPEVARYLCTFLNNLGTIASARGRPQEAESYYRQAMEADPVASAKNSVVNQNLADSLLKQNRLSEALDVLRSSLQTSRRENGDNHVATFRAVVELSTLLTRLGKYDEALPLYKEHVNYYRELMLGESPGVVDPLMHCALLSARLRRDDEALKFYTDAVRISRRTLPAGVTQAYWRMMVEQNGLHPYDPKAWANDALRRNAYRCIDDALFGAPTTTFDLADADFANLRFTLTRLIRTPASTRPAPIASGDLKTLMSTPDPAAGLYLLSIEIPRQQGKITHGQHPMLVAPWAESLYSTDDVLPDDAANWAARLAKPPEQTLSYPTLAHTGELDRGFGPVSKSDHYALVAKTTVEWPAGTYKFIAKGTDGIRLYVDGKRIIDHWPAWSKGDAYIFKTAVESLTPVRHELRVEYFQIEGGQQLWISAEPVDPSTIATAKKPATTQAEDGLSQLNRLSDEIGAARRANDPALAQKLARQWLENPAAARLDAIVVADQANELARYFAGEHRHATAAALYRRVYDLRVAKLGMADQRTRNVANALCGELTRLAKPEPLAQAIVIRRAVLDDQLKKDAASLVAVNLRCHLAQALHAAGRDAEVAPLVNQVMDLIRQHAKEGKTEDVHACHRMANALFESEDYPAVEQAFTIALGAAVKIWDPKFATDRLMFIAQAQSKQGHFEQAEKTLRDAIELRIKRYGQSSVEVNQTTLDLAIVLTQAKRESESLALLRRVRNTEMAMWGSTNDEQEQTALRLAGALAAAKVPAEEVKGVYQQAIDRWIAVKEPARTGRARRAFGNYLLAQLQTSVAESQFVAAHKAFAALGQAGASDRLDTAADLARLYQQTKQATQAEQWRRLLPDSDD